MGLGILVILGCGDPAHFTAIGGGMCAEGKFFSRGGTRDHFRAACLEVCTTFFMVLL